MGLKGFHIVFIIASILLSFGFALWANQHSFMITAIISFLIGISLIVYGIYFMKKKSLINSLLTALILLNANNVLACSVCFSGDANDPMNIGLRRGIITLLSVLGFLMILFIKFFLSIKKRSKVLKNGT